MEILKQQDQIVCLEKRNNRFVLSKNKVDITNTLSDFTKYLALVIESLRMIDFKYGQLIKLNHKIYNKKCVSQELYDEENKFKYFKLLETYQDLQLQIVNNQDDFQIQFTNPYFLDYEELKQLGFKSFDLSIYANIWGHDQKTINSEQLDYINSSLKKSKIKLIVDNIIVSFKNQRVYSDLPTNLMGKQQSIDLTGIQSNSFYISYKYSPRRKLKFKVNVSSICRFLVQKGDELKVVFDSFSCKTLSIHEGYNCYFLSNNKMIKKIKSSNFIINNTHQNLFIIKNIEIKEKSIHELTLLRLAVIKKQNYSIDNIQNLLIDLILN